MLQKRTSLYDQSGKVVGEAPRHSALRVVSAGIDGDGNPICVEIGDRIPVMMNGVVFVDASATRQPDELDMLALKAGGGERWRRIASALRTKNYAKLHKELKGDVADNELSRRATLALRDHALIECCERCDELPLTELSKLRASVEGIATEEQLARIERQGKYLVDAVAIFGDPTSNKRHVKEGAMLVDREYLDGVDDGEIGEALEIRRQAAKQAELQNGMLHALYVEGSEYEGPYARLVDNHGEQESGDRFHTYLMRRGMPVYAHIYFVNRAFVFTGTFWQLIDDFDIGDDETSPAENVLLTTTNLQDYRKYRHPLIKNVRLSTIDTICLVRKIEGNAYFGKGDFKRALGCYTCGIELSHEIRDDALKVTLLLNRAETRTKFGGRMPDLRAGLSDVERARRIDPDDPRVYLKKAKLRALLGDDFDDASHCIKTALALDSSPQTKKSAALVNRILRGQKRPGSSQKAFALKAISSFS